MTQQHIQSPAWDDRARVDLPRCPTDIAYGARLYASLGTRLRAWLPDATRVAWIVDEHVDSLWPVPSDVAAKFDVTPIVLPRGERAKTWSTLKAVIDLLLSLRRDEPVIVVGGGAATDVGGLAACLARRGMPWMAVPTTVVGMCDAAIGGKVAINSDAGKNLVGAFYPPSHVVCDVATLRTLDTRDAQAGLAEIYKCGWVRAHPQLESLPKPDSDVTTWGPWIAVAGRIKASLVEQDERDLGQRRLLNYGHTIGHALERLVSNDTLRHGEAVAIGMVAAAELSVARGLLTRDDSEAQRAKLSTVGLPVQVPRGIDEEQLLRAMAHDKKRSADETHTFILPTMASGKRSLLIATDVRRDEVLRALTHM